MVERGFDEGISSNGTEPEKGMPVTFAGQVELLVNRNGGIDIPRGTVEQIVFRSKFDPFGPDIMEISRQTS